MERAIEILAAIHFLVLGISHVVHRAVWVEFFTWLRERGRAGVFAHGFLSLGFGSLVVGFHEVWTWPAAVLTVVGWAYVLKGFLCFVAPGQQLRSLERVSPERAWEFAIPGVGYLVLSALLGYLVLTG